MAKTHEQFVTELLTITPSIEVIGHYTRAHDRIAVRCKECGKEWTPLAYQLTAGRGCPHCSAVRAANHRSGTRRRKGLQEFIDEMKAIDSTIEVVGEYKNNKTPIRCHCLRCGTNWAAVPNSLLNGHGCPRCAKSGTSFMEQFILLCFRRALGEENVLSRDKTTIGMELDILIPAKQAAFEPGNWFLHKRWIKRDTLKRQKCAEKGIRLITIYDNYPSDNKAPFEYDCITYSKDYNVADHVDIRKLVSRLFKMIHVKYDFSEDDWNEITNEAYLNSRARTHEQFVEELSRIAPDIMAVGKYVNANKRMRVRCKVCGFEWDAVPASLLSGDGCRKCGTKTAHKKFLKSQEEFVSEVKQVNPSIEIIGLYSGRHSPVAARCLVCGYEWTPQASSLLRGSTHKGAKTMHKKLEGK